MGTIPFALTLNKLFDSAGSDAGLASIVGLAVLALLYFAQARETSTLRRRLDDAEEHASALEHRLGHLSRVQPVQPAPVTPPPAQPVASRPMGSAVYSVRRGPVNPLVAAAHDPGAPVPFLGAPAGTGAPALAAATKLIPTSEPEPALASSIARQPIPVGAAVPVGGGGFDDAADGDTVLVAPGPITVAAGANGHSLPPVAPPPPVSSPTATVSSGGPPARVQGRPDAEPVPAPRRAIPPTRPPATRGPSPARRLIPALIGLGAIAVIVVVLLIVTGGSSPKTAANHRVKSVASHRHKGNAKAAAFSPASVTVAVLNGTAITNLAHDLALRLEGFGYKVPQGMVATAADQTHATTIVAYTKGNQADAVQVAKSLKLSASAVQPVDSTALGVACPTSAGSTCNADVVVTIGTDLSSASTTSTTTQ